MLLKIGAWHRMLCRVKLYKIHYLSLGVVQPIYKEDSNAVDMNKTAESIARALQRVRNEYYNQS